MTASELAPEVAAYHRDVEALGPINVDGIWNVTVEWQAKFIRHRDALIPLATDGNTDAQYALAGIYMLGLLHASEEDAVEAFSAEVPLMTRWLERAAASGHIYAIDNLMTGGVGDEAERLKSIYRDNPSIFRNSPPPGSEWEAEMRLLYELAYVKHQQAL